MLAVGCLIPFVLIIAGAAIGWAVGGGQWDSIVGAAIGAAVGIAAMLVLVWGWDRIAGRRE